MPQSFSDELPELQEQPGPPSSPFPGSTWERINDSQLGVAVRDPDGHNFGMGTAIRLGLFPGWSSIDGKKHTIVGEVDRYRFFDGDGAEADFNIYIVPDLPYAYLLDDVVNTLSPDEKKEVHKRERVDRNAHCMECEITPDEHYYDNPWFRKNVDTSPLVGKTLGLYGPWVSDHEHGRRPEIHPSEVIWWKSLFGLPGSRRVEWRILVLQDDSNRYDRSENYFSPGVSRPWSASPRRAHIVMALEARRGRNTTFNIDIERGRNEFVHADELRNISKTLDSHTTVTVSKEGMSRHGRVKARLSHNVGADPTNDFYRLFLHLFVEVGRGDRGDEGYAEIVVNSAST